MYPIFENFINNSLSFLPRHVTFINSELTPNRKVFSYRHNRFLMWIHERNDEIGNHSPHPHEHQWPVHLSIKHENIVFKAQTEEH